ncbi:hypothetical protein J7643_17290 [bacterium]|nr:hypothetical protein [bacterium]
MRITLRRLIATALCLVPLAACASEEDGILLLPGTGDKPGVMGEVGGEEPSDDPTPPRRTPTPAPTSSLPEGWDRSLTMALAVQNPSAIGVDGSNNVYVLSQPSTPDVQGKPYRLSQFGAFGAFKQQVALEFSFRRMAFSGPDVLLADGTHLMRLDASMSVIASEVYNLATRTSPALAVRRTNAGEWLALAGDGTIALRTPTKNYTLNFAAGEAPISLAFDQTAGLWALGGDTLAYYDPMDSYARTTVSVAGIGALKDLAPSEVQSEGFCWVLGSAGLARYALGFDGERITVARAAAPYATAGDRLFVRKGGNAPIVVNDTTGVIQWLDTAGSPLAGSGGLSSATMPGGIAGAAVDSTANLWVAGKSNHLVGHTRTR